MKVEVEITGEKDDRWHRFENAKMDQVKASLELGE